MTPEKMKDIRSHSLEMSQVRLGKIVGLTGRHISHIETGRIRVPTWMPFALAQIAKYGENEPFAENRTPQKPVQRC